MRENILRIKENMKKVIIGKGERVTNLFECLECENYSDSADGYFHNFGIYPFPDRK